MRGLALMIVVSWAMIIGGWHYAIEPAGQKVKYMFESVNIALQSQQHRR